MYGIIEEYEVKVLNEQEIFYIDKYDTYINGYNSTFGGEGVRGFIVSNDIKEKISNSLKGKNHPMFRKQQTEELKKIWSEIKKGKNNPMYGKV
ncbi:MAG: NUMOD3 domain-containing DNA-binding protein, partial [bacterium]